MYHDDLQKVSPVPDSAVVCYLFPRTQRRIRTTNIGRPNEPCLILFYFPSSRSLSSFPLAVVTAVVAEASAQVSVVHTSCSFFAEDRAPQTHTDKEEGGIPLSRERLLLVKFNNELLRFRLIH